MAQFLITTGFMLLTVAKSNDVQWVEIISLRNIIHNSDFPDKTISSLTGCMALCTLTPGCTYVTYRFTSESQNCIRHSQLQGQTSENGNRIWKDSKTCDPGGVYSDVFGNCIYYMYSPRLNWADAKEYCEDRNERLIVTNTEEKYQTVKTLFSDRSNFWIGGNPRTSDGVWVWLTGDAVDLTMFHPGQPSGGSGKLSFWNNNGQLALDDLFPHEKHEFLCETV